ncbi:MAG: glycosyltransferase [Ruminococcus sp.]|nr:glycosyltransferase [Ruminococcus sp.]
MTSSFFATVMVTFGEYDVIHFHVDGPCFWMWRPRLFGKRCVATIHGLDFDREKWKSGIGSKYIKHGEKMAVKHASEIIVGRL